MWLEFWISAIVCAIVVYVPSYAILIACRFSKITSAAFAPIVSLLIYSFLAILYGKLGVSTNGWMLFVPQCAIAVLICCARLLVGFKNASKPKGKYNSGMCLFRMVFDEQGRLIGLYILIGVIVASYVFVASLDSANSTMYAYDDQTHLGVVQSFLERGNYSSLDVNYTSFDIGGVGSYYPTAWHALVASLVTVCGVENYVGVNAVMFVMAAFMYPLSCLMAVRKLFSNDRNVQVSGAFFTLAFAAFPWEFFIYGRLVSNFLAFCSLPAMLACTVCVFEKGAAAKSRVSFAILLFASFVLSVFTQPSVCFSWLYFSVPYFMHVLWNWRPGMSKKRKIALVAGFCIAVFLFLLVCYVLPFLYELTRFKWPARITVVDAICDVLLQRAQKSPMSIILAILVACGIFFAIKKPKTRWIVLLYVMFACLYVIDAGTNLKLKNYTVGWWYTDSHRVLAMFAIVSYLLAALGMGRLADVVTKRKDSVAFKNVLRIGSPALALVLTMMPSFTFGQSVVQTPIGHVKSSISGCYSTQVPDNAALLSAPEYEFIQEAAEITGDDLVFNIPKDGSAFAYQSSGMKVLTRSSYEGISSDTDFRLLQRGLDDIARNASVRRAADELGVKYVLMLDYGHKPFFDNWQPYSDSNWTGILSIDDETPGFELVMAEDDMRLYRILSKDETMAQAGIE